AGAEGRRRLGRTGLFGLFRGSIRPPLEPTRLAVLLWAGWTLTYVVVYSGAGGIFHFYYLTTLGPPLAALAAVGLMRLWAWYRESAPAAVLLPGALLITAMWQCYVHSTGLGPGADHWQRPLPVS